MAIAIALPRFDDLGRLVIPTFLLRNRFYVQLSPHCPKMNKKSMLESFRAHNSISNEQCNLFCRHSLDKECIRVG